MSMAVLCITVALSLALLGCTSSPSAAVLEAKIESGQFSGPGGTFQVKVPDMDPQSFHTRAEWLDSDTYYVAFSDNFCREFVVVEQKGNFEFDSIMNLMYQVRSVYDREFERPPEETAYVTGWAYLLYTVPESSSCIYTATVSEGGVSRAVNKRYAAQKGVCATFTKGRTRVYAVIYTKGILDRPLPDDPSPLRDMSVKEALSSFVKGFRYFFE